MFNKTGLFKGFKDCSQRGTDQSTGDALAHPLTPCNSAPVPQPHFSLSVLKTIQSCVMQKLIKSKVLKHFALTGLSVIGQNEVVPVHRYNGGVISIVMMGHLTTVTVFAPVAMA